MLQRSVSALCIGAEQDLRNRTGRPLGGSSARGGKEDTGCWANIRRTVRGAATACQLHQGKVLHGLDLHGAFRRAGVSERDAPSSSTGECQGSTTNQVRWLTEQQGALCHRIHWVVIHSCKSPQGLRFHQGSFKQSPLSGAGLSRSDPPVEFSEQHVF